MVVSTIQMYSAVYVSVLGWLSLSLLQAYEL